LNSIQKIISPFFIYWRTGDGHFDLLVAIIFIFLVASVFFLCYSIILLLDALTGKTVCNEDSLIFFGKIQNHLFDEYYHRIKDVTKEDISLDRIRQIHNCSKRCTEKFKSYNKAIFNIKLALVSLFLFMFFLVIFNSLPS